MSKKRKVPNFCINAFYESKFRDALFIVKAGGKIIEDPAALDNLVRDIKDLTMHGIKVLLIYGAGRATDEALEARGIEIKKHEGRRVTDGPTFSVFKEVIAGQLSLKVYEAMAKNDLEGLNLNAIPADWLDVELRPKKPIDFGFVGDINKGHLRPVDALFKSVDFIAAPCLAWADDGTPKGQTLCNINADTVATEIGIATQSDKLIFLSDVDGVHIDGETAFIITDQEVPGYIEDGTVTGGMIVKMQNCQRALEAGVKRIHLINGLRKDALRKEIFESIGPGTMLIREDERENYMNEIEAHKFFEGKA